MEAFTAARAAMVEGQVRPSDVTRPGIVDAMLSVPRERFVPASRRSVAYADGDLPLSDGRALLAPRTFAKMLDAAEIAPGEAVLDIGCATGYSCAVIARLCRGVIGLESDADMVKTAESTLSSLAVDNAAIVNGPMAEGLPSESPFDVIIVEGGITGSPQALYDQLAEDGRLVALWPDQGAGQVLVAVKSGGAVSTRWVFDATAPMLPGFERPRAFAF